MTFLPSLLFPRPKATASEPAVTREVVPGEFIQPSAPHYKKPLQEMLAQDELIIKKRRADKNESPQTPVKPPLPKNSIFPPPEQPSVQPEARVIFPPRRGRAEKRPNFLDADPFAPLAPQSKMPMRKQTRQTPPVNELFARTTRTMKLESKFDKIDFKQRNVGNCYFLAALYTILKNPESRALFLKHSKLEEVVYQASGQKVYRFTFPSGNSVEVPVDEVGKEKGGQKPVSGPKMIKLLELAFAKMERSERNRKLASPYPNDGMGHTFKLIDAGTTLDAMKKIMGPYLQTNSLYAASDEKIKDVLQAIDDDKQSIYLLTASTPPQPSDTIPRVRLRNGTEAELPGGHAWAVRRTETGVAVINPHDTAAKVYEMGTETLGRNFRGLFVHKLRKEAAPGA